MRFLTDHAANSEINQVMNGPFISEVSELERKPMFDLNLTSVFETRIAKNGSDIERRYHFSFADGERGTMFDDGLIISTRITETR